MEELRLENRDSSSSSCSPYTGFLVSVSFAVANDDQQLSKPPQNPSEAPTEASVAQLKEEHVAADFANLLAPLIDPAKLDTLKGKRAATPRLRKA